MCVRVPKFWHGLELPIRDGCNFEIHASGVHKQCRGLLDLDVWLLGTESERRSFVGMLEVDALIELSVCAEPSVCVVVTG